MRLTQHGVYICSITKLLKYCPNAFAHAKMAFGNLSIMILSTHIKVTDHAITCLSIDFTVCNHSTALPKFENNLITN